MITTDNFMKNLFFFFLAMPSLIIAQTTDYEKFQIFAPNTYALGQYGDVPVDLASGLPQISIPVMSLVDRDIHVDVSLSYHASGIKVDQESSSVGLGFVLNAGGVITRQIIGGADEDYYGRTSIPDFTSGEFAAYRSLVAGKLYNASHEVTDNGPDMFYFNFCGRSGKFFFDATGDVVFADHQDFAVEFVRDYSRVLFDSYFIITDDAGLKYEFKSIETTHELTSSGRTYISGWYLSRITSPSGGEVLFSYVAGGTISSTARIHNVCYMAINQNNEGEHSIPTSSPYDYQNTYIGPYSHIGGLELKKITASCGNSIEFEFNGALRMDAESGSGINTQVDAIVLKDVNGVRQRKFVFNYSYFEANNSHKRPSPQQHLNYRLRLDSFQEVSKDNVTQSPYKFDYYGDNDPTTDDPYTLPYRLSPSQDHWGYYNHSNNTSIFPSNPASLPFHIDTWNPYFVAGDSHGSWARSFLVTGGGTREPSEEAMKAASLKRITYPTGGYTEFDFEAQFPFLSYDAPPAAAGGLRIKEVRTGDDNGHTMTKSYSYEPYYFDTQQCSFQNKYYTVYHHNYNPDLFMPGSPEVMMAFGVPEYLAFNHDTFLRIDAAPQVHLGSGREAIYSRVTEAIAGNGRTEYHYSFTEDMYHSGVPQIDGIPTPGMFHSAYVIATSAPPGYGGPYYPIASNACTQPFPEFVNNDWRRGRLLLKEVFSEDGRLLKQDSFIYDIRALHAVPGYKLLDLGGYQEYIYARYYTVGGMAKVTQEISREYFASGVVRTAKQYAYNSPYHKKVTEDRTYTSGGDVILKKYHYPADYGSYFDFLKQNNFIVPVDIRVYRGGKLISGKQVKYNAKGLPEIIYNAESGGSDIAFNAGDPFTFSSYVRRFYNADGNLKMLTTRSGSQSAFFWSYDQTVPVVKAENIDSTIFIANVHAAAANAGLNLTTWIVDPVAEKTKWQNFNIQLRNLCGSDVPVSTYTYSPLVGMTSHTDPAGMTTYYSYDNFNRLALIKDSDGNVVKKFDYHYKQ